MSAVVASMLVGMLLLMGLAVSHEVRIEAELYQADVERTQALAAAMAGVQASLAVLDRWGANGWDSLDEGWGTSTWLARQPVGEMSFSVGYREGANGEYLSYGVADENRRLPRELLRRETIDRIPLISDAARSYLRQVIAMEDVRIPWTLDGHLDARDRALLSWLVSEVDCGHVNINTAPVEVLVALGVPRSGAEKVVGHRLGPDRKPGTRDDRPFRDLTNSQEAFRPCGLDSHEATSLSYLVSTKVIDVRSNVFRIRSRGFRPGETAYCEVETIVERDRRGRWATVRQLHHWDAS